MRESLEKYLAWFGIAVTLGTYAAFFVGLFRDILYVVAITAAFFLLSIWFCVAVWKSRAPSVAERMGGQQLEPRHGTRISRIAATALFTMTLVLLASLIGCYGSGILAIVDVELGNVNGPIYRYVVDENAVPHRALLCGIGESSRTREVWNPAGEDVAVQYPCASPEAGLPIQEVEDTTTVTKEKIARLIEYNEAIRFSVQMRHHVPWAEIKSVQVVVTDFAPPPLIEPLPPEVGPLIKVPSVFLCRIGPVSRGEQRTFVANYFDGEKEVREACVFLEDNLPNPFILCVQPTEPGIYTYRCEVVVQSPVGTNSICFLPRRHVYFINEAVNSARWWAEHATRAR